MTRGRYREFYQCVSLAVDQDTAGDRLRAGQHLWTHSTVKIQDRTLGYPSLWLQKAQKDPLISLVCPYECEKQLESGRVGVTAVTRCWSGVELCHRAPSYHLLCSVWEGSSLLRPTVLARWVAKKNFLLIPNVATVQLWVR